MENNDELVEFLKEQIEVKDKQIEALNTVLISFSQEKRSGAAVQISEDLGLSQILCKLHIVVQNRAKFYQAAAALSGAALITP